MQGQLGETLQFLVAIAHLEALFPILILLQEIGIINDDLSICNLELKDAIVHRFRRLHCADRFFQVDIERPQLERLEQPCLNR